MSCLLPCASQESVVKSEASSDSGPLYGASLSSERASSLYFSVTSVLTAAAGASPTFRFAGTVVDSSIADSKMPSQCLYISYDIGSPKSEAKRRNCAPYRLGLDDADGSPIMMCSGLPRCMTVDESMLRVDWGGLALIQFPELEALRSFTKTLKDVAIEHKSLALAPRSPQPPPHPLLTANRVGS